METSESLTHDLSYVLVHVAQSLPGETDLECRCRYTLNFLTEELVNPFV